MAVGLHLSDTSVNLTTKAQPYGWFGRWGSGTRPALTVIYNSWRPSSAPFHCLFSWCHARKTKQKLGLTTLTHSLSATTRWMSRDAAAGHHDQEEGQQLKWTSSEASSRLVIPGRETTQRSFTAASRTLFPSVRQFLGELNSARVNCLARARDTTERSWPKYLSWFQDPWTGNPSKSLRIKSKYVSFWDRTSCGTVFSQITRN